MECTDNVRLPHSPALCRGGFWQHPFGLTTTRTESFWNFSEAGMKPATQRQESPHFSPNFKGMNRHY